jgi:uncharacterized protein YwqG
MLGHAPSSQHAMPVESDAVCLLQLVSDPGVGFEFGDVGEATFWIKSDDLAAMCFDNTWATLEGH